MEELLSVIEGIWR